MLFVKNWLVSFSQMMRMMELTPFISTEEKIRLVHHERTGALTCAKEDHYVLVGQPHDKYLTHLSVRSGNAAAISQAILEFSGEYDINNTLNVIGCDSTNVNTGCNGREIHRIEEKIGHKLIWLICLLHTNELALRRLFASLDGKTTGKDSFSGWYSSHHTLTSITSHLLVLLWLILFVIRPIGKLCQTAELLRMGILRK